MIIQGYQMSMDLIGVKKEEFIDGINVVGWRPWCMHRMIPTRSCLYNKWEAVSYKGRLFTRLWRL